MRRLSEGARRLSGQGAFKVLAKARELEAHGREILHFEVGEPDFDTPRHIVDEAKRALDAGLTHYTPSSGIRELREAICDEVEMTRGFRPDIEQVLVAPGANPMLYFTVACLVDEGGELILQDPGFMTYYAVNDYVNPKAKRILLQESNRFRMSPDDVREAVTDKTRLIIMNSPQNPTGSVMTKAEIEAMAEIAEERDTYLLTDEIYSKLVYDQGHHTPALRDQCRERTIILDGFSKAYAMTGWRLGYCIGPKDVIEKMNLLLQTIVSCTSTFTQWAGIAALAGPQGSVKEMRDSFRERRDVIVDGLNSAKNVSCVMPEGAFYAFPNITKTGMSSAEFADHMLQEAGVACVPGTAFGPGGEGYVRFSYATSMENIKKAIAKMKKAL